MAKLAEVLGSRIKQRRNQLNLTQRDLAKHCNLGSSQIVSQIEQGTREVKAWELAKIAHSLKVDMQELLEGEEPSEMPSVLWRQRPDKESETIEADLLMLCKRYHHVEKLSGTQVPCRIPELPLAANYTEIDAQVNQVSDVLDLGSRPASSLINVLEERCGVKIFYKELESGSAASVIGDFGPAILMNLSEAPWRRNYNFAHEFYHLITWKSISPGIKERPRSWDKMEKLANYFASCLLLPLEPLKVELEKAKTDQGIAYIDLVNIARDFGVSTQALLWRCFSLRLFKNKGDIERLLKDPAFQQLDKGTMSEHWWKPRPLPERYVRLAFSAYIKGKLSRMRIAEYLDTSLIDLDNTLAEYGIEAAAEYETKLSVA